MNDHELDVLLRRSAPVSDAQIAALDIGDALDDLSRDIAVHTPAARNDAAAPRPATAGPGRRHRVRAGPRRLALVGGLAAALVAAGFGVGGHVFGGPDRAWSAEAVRFAEGSPRILIAGDDYRIVRADQTPDYGEAVFALARPTAANSGGLHPGSLLLSASSEVGGVSSSARWYPAAVYTSRLDRLSRTAQARAELGPVGPKKLAARAFRTGSGRFAAIWRDGANTIEVTAVASSPTDFARSVDEMAGNLTAEQITPSQEVQVTWYEARTNRGRLQDKAGPGTGTTDRGTAPALGEVARLVQYDGSDRFRAQWVSGDTLVEVDGIAAGEAAFRDVLSRMRTVDVDTWLRAMPASVVQPRQTKDAATAMLADIPLPPGLEVTELRAQAGDVRDRYQLGASVVGQVACGWMDEWVVANHDGDTARQQAAARALAGSRHWSVLKDMDAEGDYPEVVWRYADVVNGVAPGVPADKTPQPTVRSIDGVTVPVPAGLGDYAAGLGCK